MPNGPKGPARTWGDSLMGVGGVLPDVAGTDVSPEAVRALGADLESVGRRVAGLRVEDGPARAGAALPGSRIADVCAKAADRVADLVRSLSDEVSEAGRGLGEDARRYAGTEAGNASGITQAGGR